MTATILATVALAAALVAVVLLVRDRRRHASEVAQLNQAVAAVNLTLTHHLNTSARWNG